MEEARRGRKKYRPSKVRIEREEMKDRKSNKMCPLYNLGFSTLYFAVLLHRAKKATALQRKNEKKNKQ